MRIRNYIAISLCFLSFTATAQYTLQGNAVSVGGSCYQLTEAVVDQVGAVWYDETIDLAQPFDLQFKMN